MALPVNFNQLYYFWIVAKSGGISAAGERLYLTPPTLSLQMRSLEKSLGCWLLRREGRGLALTPEGRLALDYCERIFGPADELAARLQRGQPPDPPALRLAVDESASGEVVLRLLSFVEKRAPNVRPRLSAGEAAEVRDRLLRGGADVLLSTADLSQGLGPDFRARLLARLPLIFVAAPKLRGRVRRFPRDLSRVPLLLRGTDNPTRKAVDHFLYTKGVQGRPAAELEDLDILRRLAMEGRGVAVLDAMTAARDLRRGGLVRLHAGPSGLEESLWLVCPRRHRQNPAVQAAMDDLMDRFILRP